MPALDAVLFLAPRKSQVDVVQAVGRVMRKAAGKEMGYIILPVVISPDEEPEQALNDNETFKVVWDVLRALRSHDDRFDLEINSLDLNKTRSDRIIVIGGGEKDERDSIGQLSLDLVYKIPLGAIYARIVEKCGDRKYWPQWAEDVAAIADHALQQHFGRRLTGEDVHILDPFTGTGTFIVRLLQNQDLIQCEDLVRKFQSELHANEIVLLAYYIAAINIEEAYHGRRGMETEYAPFDGIVFTDTFTLGEDEGQFAETFPINSKRVERQQGRDITVIMGNPPYSAGQKSAGDDNPNVSYPHLAGRIEETYAARSKAGLKKSLYDSYKLAIRWASDRIEDKGIIAFVTNASFIDGNAESGLRACLADEFSHAYVFNLRGNANTSGERRKKEGGNVFGQSTRTPVAIMVLVRDPAHQGECQIRYKDIGDYLSQKEKLRIIKGGGTIAGISDWQRIAPDEHHDWLEQRDSEYQRFMPLAIKSQKLKPDVSASFSLLSLGISTNRDSWVYSFDSAQLHRNIETMVVTYEERRQSVMAGEKTVEQAGQNDAPTKIKWTQGLRDRLRREEVLKRRSNSFRQGMYRPFCKQNVYFDPQCIERISRIPLVFPTPASHNQVIGVTGRGETVAFSTLITDTIPNLHLVASSQWVPRWRYEAHDPHSQDALGSRRR